MDSKCIMKRYKRILLSSLMTYSLTLTPSLSSPWANPGNSSLRSDIELLSQYGLITGPVNNWPMSWKQITRDFHKAESAIYLYLLSVH